MALRMKPVISTLSACAISLAFSSTVLASDVDRSPLPSSGGYLDDWYFNEPDALERSDLAALETETLSSRRADRDEAWDASDVLPTPAGYVDDWYLNWDDSAERSDFAAFDGETIRAPGAESTAYWETAGVLPTPAGHVDDWYLHNDQNTR